MFTLNCKGKLISFSDPVVMGIINITPDSFYEGSRTTKTDDALKLAERMIREGAGILDVGGQSTRPGSRRLPANEEMARVLPVIELISKKFNNIPLSIDTYNSIVARSAVNAGASIINDISSGNMDTAMLPLAAELGVPYICMHMKGTPENMQIDPVYENISLEVLDFFIAKIDQCKRAGINDVIIDPGFGFGKNIDHNFQLLKNMSVLKMLGKPVMAGLSRKSTIYKILGVTANEALNGTTALNMIALQNGANLLRVHDVKEAVETVKLYLRMCEYVNV